MLSDVLACLACPICDGDLRLEAGCLRCRNGHTYDVARQGYANLLPGGARPGTADTAAMVAARDAFLAAGHFAPIADAVARAAVDATATGASGCVLETGAGTGYYLARVLERLPDRRGVAIDLSKQAAARAARAHARIGSLVADTWARLPIRSGATAVLLDVFAPRNAVEFARVLAGDGTLILVTPTERHAQELVGALGLVSVDADKESRTAGALSGYFERLATVPVEHSLHLSHNDVASFVAMGPSSRHLSAERLDATIAALPDPTTVTLSVTADTYRLRSSDGA